MGANARRGEVTATIDGRERILCLTLGALAELEAAFGASDLTALAERFATGRLSARDLMRILAAGLSGGGERVSEDDVAAMKMDGGLAALAEAVAKLLRLTFGTSGEGSPDP